MEAVTPRPAEQKEKGWTPGKPPKLLTPPSSCVPQPSGQQRAANWGTLASDVTDDATGKRVLEVIGSSPQEARGWEHGLPNSPWGHAMWRGLCLGFWRLLSRQDHFQQCQVRDFPKDQEGPLVGTSQSHKNGN